jgi:hypothetical protein
MYYDGAPQVAGTPSYYFFASITFSVLLGTRV